MVLGTDPGKWNDTSSFSSRSDGSKAVAEGEQEEDNGSGDGELAIVDGNDGSKRL